MAAEILPWRAPPPFSSILFAEPDDRQRVPAVADVPEYFSDLNLDQIVRSVTAGREKYDLEPFFFLRLTNVEAVRYRQDVFSDLEDTGLSAAVGRFAGRMRGVRARLLRAAKLRYNLQRQRWFLDAAAVYCDAVTTFVGDLTAANTRSHGLRGFQDYLANYVESTAFKSLASETTKVSEQLASIRYCLRITGNRITVSKYDGEADYSVDVLSTFERFKQAAAGEYLVKFSTREDMNHIEAHILKFVAELHEEAFAALSRFCTEQRDFLDDTIRDFDREVQFYAAYLELVDKMRSAGLEFCRPDLSDRSKSEHVSKTFDLALANNLVPKQRPVVCNDFSLDGRERLFVVSGPNQGGKTTFARTFGQLHHLASLGCPVPGRDARLFLSDQIFTHFEREENIETLRGKLQDDLIRIHRILEHATPDSIVILNEIFTSTSLQDALFLGRKVLQRVVELDALCVCVTFIDEWATLGDSTVSMMSTVDPANPAERTFKVIRRAPDGLAYAAVIAEKYGLTYEALKKRIAS